MTGAIFQRGFSGIRAQQESIDTISNNVANASTVGFKKSKAIFGDLYNANKGGFRNAPGAGVRVLDIQQNFSQGAVNRTGLPTDLAINGEGFFQLTNPLSGETFYSRNGQFIEDNEQFLTTVTGNRLQGFALNQTTGQPIAGALQDIQIDRNQMAPQATTNVNLQLNFNASEPAIDAAIPFDVNDPDTYTQATSLSVFDLQGARQDLNLYFRKDTVDATGNATWQVFAQVAGQDVPINGAASIPVRFGANGLPVNAAGEPVGLEDLKFEMDFSQVTNADGILTFAESTEVGLDLSDARQFGSNFQVVAQGQDGFPTGEFLSYFVDDQGLVTARYSNGKERTQAQVALFDFQNRNGLTPDGENNFIQTSEAGDPIAVNNRSSIISGAVEESNVDLTGELIDMIGAQRIYQANSESIKTQDDLLQTAIAIKN